MDQLLVHAQESSPALFSTPKSEPAVSSWRWNTDRFWPARRPLDESPLGIFCQCTVRDVDHAGHSAWPTNEFQFLIAGDLSAKILGKAFEDQVASWKGRE